MHAFPAGYPDTGQTRAWTGRPRGMNLYSHGRRPFWRSPTVSPFDRIVIIFNPQSTGDAPRSAEDLRDELARRLPAVPLDLCPTRHAGHARDLARKAAGSGRPLVVSV